MGELPKDSINRFDNFLGRGGFGGLQVCWIGSVFWSHDLARPQNGGEFRKSLERIRQKEQRPRGAGGGLFALRSIQSGSGEELIDLADTNVFRRLLN